jgi:hypothetical protein
MTVFIREPGTDGSTRNYTLAPFSRGMWCVVFASMLVLTAFLSVTWYFGDKYGSHPEHQDYRACNSWITVLASFSQQGENNVSCFSKQTIYLGLGVIPINLRPL